MSLLLLAALSMGACRSPSSDGTAPRPEPSADALHGRVTVAGKDASDAEVLVVRGGQVIAVLKASPAFEIPPELAAACAELRWIVRLTAPLGVVAAQPPKSCRGAFEVAIDASRVATLRGALLAPSGVTLDWVDVKLTPRVPEIDPTLVLADGPNPNLREALSVSRQTKAAFELPVLTGTWWLAADRTIDAPVGTKTGNLRLESVTSSGSGAPRAEFGGYTLEIAADTDVKLTLREADGP
ncbi:MAG: hypothetical protein R3B48_17300 [Kofleriaceae bacterium]